MSCRPLRPPFLSASVSPGQASTSTGREGVVRHDNRFKQDLPTAHSSLQSAATNAQEKQRVAHTESASNSGLHGQPVFSVRSLCSPFSPTLYLGCQQTGRPTLISENRGPVPLFNVPQIHPEIPMKLPSHKRGPGTTIVMTPMTLSKCPYGSTLCSCKVHSSSSHFPTAFNPL